MYRLGVWGDGLNSVRGHAVIHIIPLHMSLRIAGLIHRASDRVKAGDSHCACDDDLLIGHRSRLMTINVNLDAHVEV